MRILAIVLATLCGFFFLAFLLLAGSVVETLKMIWVCRPAWPFLTAALIVFTALFGFWSGLGLYFAGFWLFAFFSSDILSTVKAIFGNRRIAVG